MVCETSPIAVTVNSRLIRSFVSMSSRGFVTFKSEESAERAISEVRSFLWTGLGKLVVFNFGCFFSPQNLD